MKFKHTIACLLLVVCAACLAATAERVADRPLVILFSNSANGILRSCYCPNSPWGGLAKQAWLAGQIRQIAGRENVLLLDAGDIFPSEPDEERLPFLLRCYSLMKYDAVALGDQDLLGGASEWRKANRQLAMSNEVPVGIPWLSAGYRIPDPSGAGDFLARPWAIKNVAGYRVGIVSVVGPEAYRFAPSNKLAGLGLTDPAGIVRDFVAAHGTNLDLTVVLSHQGLDADRELAGKVNGVDLIIGGHSQSIAFPPERVNNIMICQAGKNGENLGILVLHPRATGDPAVGDSGESATNRNPFETALIAGARWCGRGRLVALDTAVDEDASVARVVDEYYGALDRRNEEYLRDVPEEVEAVPRLRIENPVQYTVVKPEETRQVRLLLENVGNAPLAIRKMRGKTRWLSVIGPSTNVLPPHSRWEARLEVAATNIDRYFRCEYSITTTDRKRIVVGGSINGRVEGPLPWVMDVPRLMEDLLKPISSVTTQLVATTPNVNAETPTPVSATEIARPRILVEFFYAAGCEECAELKADVLPDLVRRFGDRIDLREYDIHDRASYLKLARLQENLKIRTNEKVSIFLNERTHLGGLKEIKERLPGLLQDMRESGKGDEPKPNPPLASPLMQDEEVLTGRLRSFTIGGIVLAGLVDGVNPCAFATIIFFVTLLSVTHKERRALVLVGVAFCVAVFATYLLLGLGAFAVILKLTAYKAFGDAVRWAIIVILLIFSIVSFKDAWMFRKTGRAEDVTLQLPDSIKQKIHGIMRTNLRTGSLLAGSLVVGFLVTLLESVCTGQVYVPTLVFLTRHPELQWRTWGLLVLYNLMFIVPLVVVFVAAYRGTRNQRLLEWSRSNVVWSKMLMGLFFAILAGVMVWL